MKPRLRLHRTTTTLLACAILLVSIVLWEVVAEFPRQFADQEAAPPRQDIVQTPDEPLNGSKWIWNYHDGGTAVTSPGLSGRVVSIKRIDDGLSIMMINTGEGQPSWVNVCPATVVQNSAGTKADLAIGLSVQVLYGGILYMTDPGQVDARSISIEAE